MKSLLAAARRLLFGATLLLALLAAAVWVRSYFVSHHLAYNTADASTGQCRQFLLSVDGGAVRFDHVARTFSSPEGVEWFIDSLPILHSQELGLSHSMDFPTAFTVPNILCEVFTSMTTGGFAAASTSVI